MALSNPKLKFIVKFRDECNHAITEVIQLDAKKGVCEAITEEAITYIHEGDLDICFVYKARKEFLKKWSNKAHVNKAMILLGYGPDEFDQIIEASRRNWISVLKILTMRIVRRTKLLTTSVLKFIP